MSGGEVFPATGRAIVIGPEVAARDVIKRVLARIRVETVLEAPSPMAAVEMAGESGANLIVVGQRLADAAEILACRAIREALPASRLLALTWYASGRDWIVSLIAGASACLVWQVRSLEQTSEMARRVLAGENLIAAERPDVIQELISPPDRSITAFESQVALSLARLETDSAIAADLEVPVEEVRDAVVTILRRIAPSNRLY